MNKDRLFAFREELNKLYEKFGLYIDTDGSSEACFIEPDNGDTVIIVFDKEKRSTLCGVVNWTRNKAEFGLRLGRRVGNERIYKYIYRLVS